MNGEIMFTLTIPDSRLRKVIENATGAGSCHCWACKSCVAECPVNIHTNRLQPMKIVWMANLGLLDEMIHLPEIWYCLTCNRCNRICPNRVKPAELITYLRHEAFRHRLISHEIFQQYVALFPKFHRARWHMTRKCLNALDFSIGESEWQSWFEQPVPTRKKKIESGDLFSGPEDLINSKFVLNNRLCFTCGECSSACPVFSGRRIFDPVWIFRMANLGLFKEILSSPSIWLCMQCGRCTDACSQLVKGHLIISELQEMAFRRGYVNGGFSHRLEANSRVLYQRLLNQIDDLLGFPCK